MNARMVELDMHAITSLCCAIQMALPSDVARLLQTRNRTKTTEARLFGLDHHSAISLGQHDGRILRVARPVRALQPIPTRRYRLLMWEANLRSNLQPCFDVEAAHVRHVE